MHIYLLIIVSSLIGLLSAIGGVDDVSTWVLEFSDGVQWSAIHRPAPLPPPMQDFVFRPLSIVMMKSTLLLTGGSLIVPMWLIGLKASVFTFMFGWGAYLWLSQWIRKEHAIWLAVLSISAEPALFSAYNYSEFDGLAAGLILLSSWTLSNKLNQWLSFAALSISIVFLKESACFIWLCFILPQLWNEWRENGVSRSLRIQLGIVGMVLILWFWGTSAVIGGKLQSSAGGLGLTERIPVLGFTTWQFVGLWTEGGLVLVLGWVLGWRWWLIVFWFGMAMWAPMFEINHYETRYFSRPMYVSILSMVMIGTWFRCLWNDETFVRLMAQRLLLLLGLFTVVVLTSSNLREDLASRLFLSLLPGMLLLSWRAFQSSQQGTKWIQRMGTILLCMQGWTLVIGGWNWSQRIWFEQSTHADWTSQLVEETLDVEGEKVIPIVVTDPSRRYSPRKIQDLLPNVDADLIARLHFESLCYFLSIDSEQLPQSLLSCLAHTGYARHTMDRVHVVHRGRRTELPESELQWFQRDFSWVRGGEGRGAHMPIRLGDGRCTERSLLEDVYDYTYAVEDPLYEFLNVESRAGMFQRQHLLERRYYQLPTRLLNLPFQIISGVSILEPRVFQQSVWIWSES